MDWEYYCWISWYYHNDTCKVVKMNDTNIIFFILAVFNLVAISVSIYMKKNNLSIGLSILEIILVYISSI